MKLVAVSDAHGDRQILEAILAQQPDADAYFYAGDSELPADDPLFQRYVAVRGNMDFDASFPKVVNQTVAGVPVLMTHGHYYGVNFSLNQLIAAGTEAKAAVVIFGHTHQLGVEQHAGMVVLNPGSIAQPRGEFARLGGTYAVVTTDGAQARVTYYLRDGQPAPGLQRTFRAADK